MSRITACPTQPQSECLRSAYTILAGAHDAASSFLDIFEKTRAARQARGTPTDEEQDLLRAMLVFACAGLDSMMKQVVRDALAVVIEESEGAEGNFRLFIEKRLHRQGVMDPKFLSSVLASRDPRDVLVGELIGDLTSQSLQSKDQVLRAASYFDIRSDALASNIGLLADIFSARNQISHEMDIDFGQTNRNRRPRRKLVMISYTNEILRVGAEFLTLVDRIVCEA